MSESTEKKVALEVKKGINALKVLISRSTFTVSEAMEDVPLMLKLLTSLENGLAEKNNDQKE